MPRALLPLLLLPVLLASASFAWQDDFSGQRRYERWGADCWTVGGGQAAFRGGGGEHFLVAMGPQSRQITIQSELTAASRSGGSWALAGIALAQDSGNHWRLLLVEGPEQNRYFELVEMLDGEHQAQNGGKSPRTRLESTTGGDLKTWEYGRRYQLTLALTPQGLTGTVTDPANGAQWTRAFSFATGRAVKSGRAALHATDMNGTFHSLTVDALALPTASTVKLQDGPKGVVALIPDESGKLAGRLAPLLQQAGYGVTVLPWDQLDQPLPWEKLDVLVIADARRLPTAARDRLVEATQSAGKVLCLGAPALQTLLEKSPDGWLPEDQWLRSYASRLPRRPIELQAGQWQRAAQSNDLPGGITPDPAAGQTAWKVTSELKGWDTWRATPEKPFDAQHQLLAFEAKGDATTSQLSIECTETDGSRWIATVDLTTQWQTYLLQPGDFPYWTDSKSKGRGGSGDRLQPENVAAITFGLASSHTIQVKPGAHTYWLRSVSAADGTELPQGDFHVPNLEALCPSYKLYPLNETAQLRTASEQGVTATRQFAWSQPAYSPVWRERGRGLHRHRSWRWVPVVSAFDAAGKDRGAVVSLLLGDGVRPNALWANFALADPAQALEPQLRPVLLDTLAAMVRGCFLLEGGAELFSYRPGEKAKVGGLAINLGRQPRTVSLGLSIVSNAGKDFSNRKQLVLAPGEAQEAVWTWTPTFQAAGGYEIETSLYGNSVLLDRITQPVDATRTRPATADEFVKVEGSNFTLAGKPWYFNGINYWPNRIGGYPNLNVSARNSYDPEIIERDLTYLQSLGVNALSAMQALVPTDPDDPLAFRDQLDLLDRCDRHGMKVFFFLHEGRPYYGGSFEKIRDYITRAGLKDHPAVMCWELAWEPIESNWQGRLDYIHEPWNRWIVERYGSLRSAIADWGFTPALTDGKAEIPTGEQCRQHGAWDRYVAAFRRAHSDIICAAYKDIAEPLRQWDTKHLVSFRGGACGIPDGPSFAHIHGTAAPKHMDFLNPEGYNLQTNGIGSLTPADDLRKGGLVTLFYRFTSREKPIVWMEFGYTVNGIHTTWTPELVAIKPEELQKQATELRHYYDMFLESGARGAAPWWFPGGFRLGENSDFGLVEPDGAERPACEVMRQALPKFAQVKHPTPTAQIELSLEQHYPEAWALYSQQYLDLVKAGKVIAVRTAGTGSNSQTCPLTAVGGGEYNGHNPPLYLNAEFNSLEIKIGEAPWQPVVAGKTVEAPVGAKVLCRANVGNLGEAAWLAPTAPAQAGRVYLAGRKEYGLPFEAPIAGDTSYLGDATVPWFTLVASVRPGPQEISFELTSQGRAYFGERRAITLSGR